jgi:hypothetical protein
MIGEGAWGRTEPVPCQTLIHIRQLCGANSFDHLAEFQRHARELAANPAEWMPWNFRATPERSGVSNAE